MPSTVILKQLNVEWCVKEMFFMPSEFAKTHADDEKAKCRLTVYVQSSNLETLNTLDFNGKIIILTVNDVGTNPPNSFIPMINMKMQPISVFRDKVFLHICVPGQENGANNFDGSFPTMEQMAEIIPQVLGHFNVKKCIALGEVAGADIICRFAMEYPEMLDGILLIHSTSSTHGFIKKIREILTENSYSTFDAWSTATQETEQSGEFTAETTLVDAQLDHQQQSQSGSEEEQNGEFTAETTLVDAQLDHQQQSQSGSEEEQETKVLSGVVCILTGASEGIGGAVAKMLAMETGANLVLTSRQVALLEEKCRQFCADGQTPERFLAVKCGITKEEEVTEMVERTMERYGRIDVLINCAGLMYYTMAEKGYTHEWRSQIDVNVHGTTNVIGAVLPHMIERNSGHILTITSDAGKKAFAGLAVYSGTKFYLEGLIQALRQELVEYGIRFTNIQPGNVATKLASRSSDVEARQKFGASEAGHKLEPDDVAKNPPVRLCCGHVISMEAMNKLAQQSRNSRLK